MTYYFSDSLFVRLFNNVYSILTDVFFQWEALAAN